MIEGTVPYKPRLRCRLSTFVNIIGQGLRLDRSVWIMLVKNVRDDGESRTCPALSVSQEISIENSGVGLADSFSSHVVGFRFLL